jgi:RNA polymerase sigma-70 factor (ECF subfamily)
VLPDDASAYRLGADTVDPTTGTGRERRGLDEESVRWLAALSEASHDRGHAIGRLHEMLLRIARAELRRRSGQHPIAGPELDDLAHQAASDALLAIITKLGQFRGESRFTTWAYKFVILEVSAKLGRHFWRRPTVALDFDDWDRLPDRFSMQPDEYAHHRDLIAAVRRAVEEELTERQRQVFLAIVVKGVPLDALVAQLGSNRAAIYKVMFDARRKLRAALVANGYLHTGQPRPKDSHTRRRS